MKDRSVGTDSALQPLLPFAAAETGSLALNLLLGFGVVVTAGGTLALLHSAPASVVLVAVFGAIDFYTQYFERLGASPGSIVVAGLGAIGIAMALVRYNRSDIIPRPPTRQLRAKRRPFRSDSN